MAALYWSAMTVTSIGYGEMTPVNSTERFVCCIFMLLSGMVWAYILSTAAGIAATLNPSSVLFHTTMDQLNYFMRERGLPKQMRHDLRDYFQAARQARHHAHHTPPTRQPPPRLVLRVASAHAHGARLLVMAGARGQ